MYKITKKFSICCSHRLNNKRKSKEWNEQIYGRCNNKCGHGHNYDIILTLASRVPHKDTGMIMNFNDVKKIFNKKIDDVYDHRHLNTCPGFENIIPTAENMCRVFFDMLVEEIPMLESIEIFETSGASAIYIGGGSK